MCAEGGESASCDGAPVVVERSRLEGRCVSQHERARVAPRLDHPRVPLYPRVRGPFGPALALALVRLGAAVGLRRAAWMRSLAVVR